MKIRNLLMLTALASLMLVTSCTEENNTQSAQTGETTVLYNSDGSPDIDDTYDVVPPPTEQSITFRLTDGQNNALVGANVGVTENYAAVGLFSSHVILNATDDNGEVIYISPSVGSHELSVSIDDEWVNVIVDISEGDFGKTVDITVNEFSSPSKKSVTFRLTNERGNTLAGAYVSMLEYATVEHCDICLILGDADENGEVIYISPSVGSHELSVSIDDEWANVIVDISEEDFGKTVDITVNGLS